jgi:hypothetical protein
VNFQDEELDFPMGYGEGGHYAGILKKVRLIPCRARQLILTLSL